VPIACTSFEVVPLLELFLPGFTAKKGVAVLIDPEVEVLTGHADLASFPTLELPPHHRRAITP